MLRANQRNRAAGQDGCAEGGFTLIELMVVVIVIAVLVGIAIPALMGAGRRAQDAASKTTLRNALGSAEIIFADNQAFFATPTMVTSLGTEEPALTFGDDATPSAGGRQISIATSSSTSGGPVDTIVLASQSRSGTCWYYRHVATAGLSTSGTYYATTGIGTPCQAANAPTTATSWLAL